MSVRKIWDPQNLECFTLSQKFWPKIKGSALKWPGITKIKFLASICQKMRSIGQSAQYFFVEYIDTKSLGGIIIGPIGAMSPPPRLNKLDTVLVVLLLELWMLLGCDNYIILKQYIHPFNQTYTKEVTKTSLNFAYFHQTSSKIQTP